MMSFMKDFDHLQIQMKDIVSATNNFDPAKVIGRGGFGKVFKGELSRPEGPIMVAFKQLDRRHGQGNIEFWKEIMMLSKYKHENLISLMYYCIDGDDMILVYEYASRGSLDRYLCDASTLTWIQRLRICVGAALGLQYLHDPIETQRVLHRDIKSANILLDENWTAKVADFGLSKIGPANQPHTYLITKVVGTFGYCDPLYLELGFLSKESDVYSFGVVLFEILSGRLCCEYHNGRPVNNLVPKWRRCYDEKRLDEIILVGLKDKMDQGSLNSFSAIAYQCLKRNHEERPTMAKIVKELEHSLEQQDTFEDLGNKVDSENFEVPDEESKPSGTISAALSSTSASPSIHTPMDEDCIPSNTISAALPSQLASPPSTTPSHVILNPYPQHLENIFENLGGTANLMMRIVNLAVPPLCYEQQSQLIMLLLEGFRIDDGETWISINMKGEITKVVSANKCFSGESLVIRKSDDFPVATKYIRCRFPYYSWNVYSHPFRVEVDTQFLSPHVIYTIYIVFKYASSTDDPPYYITFRHKLDGEMNFTTSCVPYAPPEDNYRYGYPRDFDGWAMSKLYQFTSQEVQQNFCIEFLPKDQIPFKDKFAFEGIEFRPLEGETHEKEDEEKHKVDRNLEQLLSSDFTDVIKLSKEIIQWTTTEELYVLLRKGFVITMDGEKWFYISKDMKKRFMIPASTFLDVDEWTCNSVFEPESRFKVVTRSLIGYDQFTIHLNLTEIVEMLTPHYRYSCHLIYKLSDNYSSFDGPMVMNIVDCVRTPLNSSSICLNPRCHPPIIVAKNDQTKSPGKMKGHAKQRKDGWMEVQFAVLPMNTEKLKFIVEEESFKDTNCFGIIIEGIECRALGTDGFSSISEGL